MNREVNVTKRVQTSKGLRYCPVVVSANGRIKPDAVMVNGKQERHTEGAYYLGRSARRTLTGTPQHVNQDPSRRPSLSSSALHFSDSTSYRAELPTIPWGWWHCLHDGQEHSQREDFHGRKNCIAESQRRK
ncbi:MAG: hypothetical protein LAO30_13420 [Acidobacteriia bacterium]|nr:hypothetical protein [Terriglobia bacterium]